MRCQLTLPDGAAIYTHVVDNAGMHRAMVQPHVGQGRRVAICGAGPSLADVADQIPADVDEVWACNSALPFLMDRGHRVTHGVTIDQGQAMLAPHEWGRTFDVQYLIASCAHPALVRHVESAGRAVTFFHSFLGMPDPEGWTPPEAYPDVSYEMWLYRALYPTGIQAGFGLNAVPRAICLALAMGFDDILVYGADCACAPDAPPMPTLGTPAYAAWIAQLVMYPDGRTASQYGEDSAMAEAVIDGQRWHTRPDMVISAMMLVELVRAYPHIQLIGHTLPRVLLEQPPEFFDDMPRLTERGMIEGFGAHTSSRLATV